MTGPVICPTCCCVFTPKAIRSHAEHGHYFAVIHAAFDNWPEQDPWQPQDAEHLRTYLQIKADHYTPVDFSTDSQDSKRIADQIESLCEAFGIKHRFIHDYGDHVRVFVPKSMSYAEADKAKFREVKQKVLEIIKERTGIDTDTIPMRAA